MPSGVQTTIGYCKGSNEQDAIYKLSQTNTEHGRALKNGSARVVQAIKC